MVVSGVLLVVYALTHAESWYGVLPTLPFLGVVGVYAFFIERLKNMKG